MQTTRYEIIVRAQTPIAHAQESLGNVSVAMRKKVRLPGGTFAQVPYVTGDSVRHQLREASAYATLHAAGLLDGDGPGLSQGALRLLFNGGMVTGKGDAAVVNVERYRELVTLFPPLALFGGCTDNRPMPGQLVVDDLNVICTENARHIPEWITRWCEERQERIVSARDCVEETQRVRMDAVLRPEKVKLLSVKDQIEVNGRHLKREKAHETDDAKEASESKSAMMPRSFERLVQGSLLWLGVEARTYTDMELDAFNYVIATALNNLRVGGKSATGHGKLEFVAGSRINFVPSAGMLEHVGAEIAQKTGDLYRAHVALHKEQLTQWLQSAVNS